ncbi:MAG: hypothetical protein IT372_40480 [Polyangiaceae bacterium]|nr:hypothetical protein [Polyangiaceae bacterium]
MRIPPIALTVLPLSFLLAACASSPFAMEDTDGDLDEASPGEAASELGVAPASNYWPLPSESITWADEQEERAYWWKLLWTRGSQRWDPNDDPAACPAGAQHSVLMSAVRMADGAFNATPLISVNMLKQHPCAYWYPRAGTDRALRWYSLGYRAASGIQVGGQSVNFLSFRGWSVWDQEHGGSTVHSGNGTESLASRFSYTFRDGFRIQNWSNGAIEEGRMPPYAVVPDRAVNVDITVAAAGTSARNPDGTLYPGSTLNTGAPIEPRYCRYSASGGWSDLRFTPDDCSGSPGGQATSGKWVMVNRSTTASYAGSPVVYVGFWEDGDVAGDALGVCEEWWFAKDVGPVYLVQHPPADLATCRQQLAINHSLYPGLVAIHTPSLYVQSPLTLQRSIGTMSLQKHCVTGACQVDYL